MTEIERLLESLKGIAGEWRGSNSQGRPGADQIRRFNDGLARLYELGWDYALGYKHELPDDVLPERYVQRRAQILDELELELGRLATRYRSSQEGTEEERQVILRYQEVMEELFRIGHWSGEPDLDAQLPERHMPKVYKDYWEKALADYAASKKKGPA
jgi:hypothetical protein